MNVGKTSEKSNFPDETKKEEKRLTSDESNPWSPNAVVNVTDLDAVKKESFDFSVPPPQHNHYPGLGLEVGQSQHRPVLKREVNSDWENINDKIWNVIADNKVRKLSTIFSATNKNKLFTTFSNFF